MDRKLDIARTIAMQKNIIANPAELQISKTKGKRFVIVKDGKRVNFGSFPFSGNGTFIDHSDKDIKQAWRARHGKIVLKDGRKAYTVPGTPLYYAWKILW